MVRKRTATERRPPAPVGILAMIVAFFLAEVLGAYIIVALAQLVVGPGARFSQEQATLLQLSYGLSSLFLFLAATAALAAAGHFSMLRTLFRWRGWAILAAGFVGGVLLKLASDLVASLESSLGQSVTQNNPLLIDPHAFVGPWTVVLLFVGVVGVAPIAEELFFRGLLFGWVRARLAFWPAALVAGAAFGLAHRSLTLLVPLGLVGVGLCWLYERYQTLWPSVVAHATLNVAALVLALYVH